MQKKMLFDTFAGLSLFDLTLCTGCLVITASFLINVCVLDLKKKSVDFSVTYLNYTGCTK